jgi:hypothetical protein
MAEETQNFRINKEWMRVIMSAVHLWGDYMGDANVSTIAIIDVDRY